MGRRGVRHLEGELKVEEEALARMFQSFPSILVLDVEGSMVPVVKFLRGIGVTNVGRFITRLPPVLGYSVENELAPKWKILRHVCEYARFEIVRFPAYFSYPLDRVIMNRYTYLRDVKNLPLRMIRTLRVDQVLRFGDDDFSRCVARDTDGEAYRNYVKEKRAQMNGKRKTKERETHVVKRVKAKRRRDNSMER